jgi:predicted pyridoxine 5'-phosphate oxidase superfamily flavin-nucleotide-binding protein
MMAATHQLADAGFHAGELAVQHRAGVAREASRLSGMLEPVRLTGVIAGFLADRTFLVVTGRDVNGLLWTSPLVGPPGFLTVFFLGTVNPERGADASHRGGAPGFVRVDGPGLWWPDYPGNNLFNSFGNLAVDPETALLFLDFTTGRTLHLSGTTEIEWGAPGRPGDDGRIARFTVRHLVAGHLLPARQISHHPYPRNPSLTD